MRIWKTTLAGATMALAISITPAAAESIIPGNMLVIADAIDDMTTFDPAEAYEFTAQDVTHNVYSKLVTFDPLHMSAGYVPDLATSWDVSEDGKTLTFTMRDGAKFSSGNPVRAEDVVFSLQRAIKLNGTPAFILAQFGFTPQNVDEMIRTDGNRVIITTDKRYAASFVLNCLTSEIAGIVDKKTVMAHTVGDDMGAAWLRTHTAGSGPYKLVSWVPNDSVRLAANPYFYGKAPAMQTVIMQHVPGSASQRLMLERGNIDIARGLNPKDTAAAVESGGIKVEDEQKGSLMYLSLNLLNPLLAKPEVIEALRYLVDYKGMRDSFLKGQWTIHQNFLPASYLGAVDENPFSLNIEKARELLASAGIEGLAFEVGVRDVQTRIDIARSLQGTFAQAGIELKIAIGTATENLGRYRARNLDAYLGVWAPDYPDPQSPASIFTYNPDNSEGAQATGILAWRNAWDPGDINGKVEEAVVENDSAKRAEMYIDIQRKFRKASPFAIMFQKIAQSVMRDGVQNFSTGEATTAASYWQVTKYATSSK